LVDLANGIDRSEEIAQVDIQINEVYEKC